MKTWTCQRVSAGERCGHQNSSRRRKCERCGKTRPARKRPAHMAALDLPYEHYVMVNGGERCGICARKPKEGKKLRRDHDHATGEPRGLLCWTCNHVLRTWVDVAWLRAAIRYLERSA